MLRFPRVRGIAVAASRRDKKPAGVANEAPMRTLRLSSNLCIGRAISPRSTGTIDRDNPPKRRGRQLRRPRDHRSTRQVPTRQASTQQASTQQGAHQQRPRGPQTQWRPGRQCAPRPPHAAFSIGVKFWAASGMLAAPRHVWASAVQASDPASRIPTAAASESFFIRLSIKVRRPAGDSKSGRASSQLGYRCSLFRCSSESMDPRVSSDVEHDRLRDPLTGLMRQQVVLAGRQGGERDDERSAAAHRGAL